MEFGQWSHGRVQHNGHLGLKDLARRALGAAIRHGQDIRTDGRLGREESASLYARPDGSSDEGDSAP